MQIYTMHVFSFSSLIFSNSRAHILPSSHKEMLTQISQLPILKPESPTDCLTQLRVFHSSRTPSSPAFQCLKPRLLLLFLPTCISFVMSFPAPSSHLTLKRSKTFQKGWTNFRLKWSTRKPKFLKTRRVSLVGNKLTPHHKRHLEL